MVLTIKQAEQILATICKSDPALCDYMKYLIAMKKRGALSVYYNDGDSLAQSIITVGGVRMGDVINQLSCDPLKCAVIFGACIC